MSLKVFYLEDHEFFSVDIIEYLQEAGHQVYYAKTYAEAEKLVEKVGSFDVSIVDVILQNGKTGIHFVSKYEPILGKIFFLTGCIDQPTIDKISKWKYASKREFDWEMLDEIIKEVK